jgi:hypothetical protein
VSSDQPHLAVTAPADLSGLQGWLIWRFEQYPDELKPRKIPYYSLGGRRYGHQGSERDRSSLTTFAAARDAAAKRGFDGVGFAPLAEFGIVALDFDKCIGPGGEIPAEIMEIIGETYCEHSPSGTGIRAFLKGGLGNHKSPAAGNDYGFETFSSTGYVTVTGNILPHVELLGLENTIAQVTSKAKTLADSRFGADRQAHGDAGDDPFAGTEQPIGLSIDDMETMLGKLDPDMDRDSWIRVGMALHFECQGDDTGFELWNSWSANGGKYPSEDALQAQWDSFSRPRPAGRRPVTAATIIRMVKEVTPPTPPPQAATAEELQALMAETPVGDPRGRFQTPEGFGGKYPIVTSGGLSRRPPGGWLIKGVLPVADVIVLFGASGSGKSFVALDMAASIARGVPWRERRTAKGRVLVIAAEGGTGVGKRLKAYAQHHEIDIDTLDVSVITAAPNFLNKEEIYEVVSAIRAAGGADLIIADTFAQVTAGANENAGEDMGVAMANAKALREATGAIVMLIHHAGKDASRGARGWSGIKAAADAEIEVIKYDDGGREIRLSKMKDGEDGLQWGFKLDVVKVGVDADGDDITSCVALDAAVPVPPVNDKPRGGVKRRTAIETHIIDVVNTIDKKMTGMNLDSFVRLCAEALPEPGEDERDSRLVKCATTVRAMFKSSDAPIRLEHGFVLFTI